MTDPDHNPYAPPESAAPRRNPLSKLPGGLVFAFGALGLISWSQPLDLSLDPNEESAFFTAALYGGPMSVAAVILGAGNLAAGRDTALSFLGILLGFAGAAGLVLSGMEVFG